MYRIMIVEDEKPILDLMQHVIRQHPEFSIQGAFTNPLEALERLEGLQPDVAFLDVEMPKMNGLELARKINELSGHTKIIFTTAYKHYALEAFQVEAFDYILKPVTKAAIERIATRLVRQHHKAGTLDLLEHQVDVSCFGGLEVRGASGELVHWPTRKTEELFAIFLCHPDTEINKWQLADWLWPEMDEERVSHNLHNTLYRLKKLLREQEMGMEIQKMNDGYLLSSGQVRYDVLEYRRYAQLLAAGKTDRVQEERLIRLYKGTLLDRKDYLWKVSLEEAFRKQYLSMLRARIENAWSSRALEQARQWIEQGLGWFPLDEELNTRLLKVHIGSGRPEMARHHFERFAEASRREWGMEPPLEMRSLIELL